MLSYCSSPRSSDTSNPESASRRSNQPNNIVHSTDSSEPAGPIRISGSQYIPIEGRRESGILPELEGKWVLDDSVKRHN
jgi:hypothetical protein